MSFEPDNDTQDQKSIMLLREILEQIKLLNIKFEEVHQTGMTVDDIEEES
jgi:hypothetical protein